VDASASRCATVLVQLRGQLLDALEEAFTSERLKLSSDWFRAILDTSPSLIRERDVKSRGLLYRVTNEERLRWLLVLPMREMSPEDRAALIKPNISELADISVRSFAFDGR